MLIEHIALMVVLDGEIMADVVADDDDKDDADNADDDDAGNADALCGDSWLRLLP